MADLDTYGFLEDTLKKIAAAGKQAAPMAEPDPLGGASAHPSAKVDDDLMAVSEGAHASELSSTLKKTVPVLSVDATPDATFDANGQSKALPKMGPTVSSPGGDPATEDNYKDRSNDPGKTTHPMQGSVGDKYASLRALPLANLLQKTASLGDALIAEVTMAAAAPAAAPAPTKAAAAADPAPAPADAAIDGLDDLALDFTATVVKEAHTSAELLHDYIERIKQATADGGGPQTAAPPDGGAPPMPPGMMGPGGPGGDPGMMPPGGPGGDPGMGGPGGDPGPVGPGGPGGPGGDPGAGGDGGVTIDELASTLMEMGIDPKELAEKMLSLSQDPGVSAGDKDTAATMAKAARQVVEHKLGGTYRFKAASTQKASKLRETMAGYVREALKIRPRG